ncbi:ArdC family protein [Ancylobacter sp.]|uniref:ArdC family protein n=1 Tax=Ancylobacter sp. TaxID=1872567 RepID=UPI003C7E04BA
MKTAELYASVTQRIINELEKGTVPWVRPWSGQSDATLLIPANLVTARPYSGINTLILWCEVQNKGYPTHGWCTFQQANEMKARVRKGEKATPVVFVKRVEKEDEQTGEKKQSTILKSYYVFNQAQLENVPPQYERLPGPSDIEQSRDEALQYQKDCGVTVVHGGNKAAYYPQRDQIVLPAFGSFEDEDAYWGTFFHEVIHASGHKERLNRNLSGRFGSEAYAAEELVAELGSAFTSARIGIPPSFRSSAYIENWLKVLKGDNQAIFRAASHASQATDFMWEQAFYAEQEETPEVEKSHHGAPQPSIAMDDAIPF